MKIMLYCPLYPARPRIHDATQTSIEEMAWRDALTIVYGREDMPAEIGYTNILRKYQQARQLALDGGFDALFSVESDIILHPLALERLSRLECDVACGLYVSRHTTRRWLSLTALDKCRGKSLSENPELAKHLWGGAVVTVGAGLGCTLIHRRVLEQIPFRKDEGGAACDWAFALDCQDKGFRTMHDLGVVCGHITGEGSTLWPDIEAPNLYREEQYGKVPGN